VRATEDRATEGEKQRRRAEAGAGSGKGDRQSGRGQSDRRRKAEPEGGGSGRDGQSDRGAERQSDGGRRRGTEGGAGGGAGKLRRGTASGGKGGKNFGLAKPDSRENRAGAIGTWISGARGCLPAVSSPWESGGITRCRPHQSWWSRWESNPRPLHCERSALSTELLPQNQKGGRYGAAAGFE
jgi:hypothetical protein